VGNMTKEPQTSVSDQVGKRTASSGCCVLHSSHGECMVSSGSCVVLSCQEHWSFVVDHVSHPYNKTDNLQDRDYVCLVEAYLGIQPDA